MINLPSPYKKSVALIEPLTSTLPVILVPTNEPVAEVVTTKVFPLATDAVAEPLAINGAAAATTFVINLPSPNIKSRTTTEPLTSTEPVNSEPICSSNFAVVTLNRSPSATDAVAEPLPINGAAAACTLVINLPSPNKKSVALILPLTSTEPVNLEPISEPVNGVITLNP